MALTSTCITRPAHSARPTAPAAPRYHELAPGTSVGRYRVIAEIGRGSHGIVYHALDPERGRAVALKSVLRKTSVGSGEDEAALLASIQSPHVVSLFDVLDHPEASVLVLELINGPTVEQVVRGRRLQAQGVVTIGVQLAAGLEAIHAAGIVHGDIKPSNLKMSDRGVLKILDLGIARRIPGEGKRAPASTDLVAGTVPYMPPEQFLGVVGDARSDIWSAGAVLFELATGRRAYDVLSPAARLAGLRNLRMPGSDWFGGEIPSALAAAIGKAMHPVPGRRFQTAEDLRRALTSESSAMHHAATETEAIAASVPAV